MEKDEGYLKDRGGRQSVASKFDDAAAVHHLSLHQKISPLNFYQFLQKEFPLFDHSAGSKKKQARERPEYRVLILRF